MRHDQELVSMTKNWPRGDEPPTGLTDLDLLVLWALWREADYPYQVRQRIAAVLPGEELVKTGTLYKRIKGLAADGLLEESGRGRDAYFPERTYYVATEQGRGLFTREVSRRLCPERWTDAVRCPLRMNLRLATVLPPAYVGGLLRARESKLRQQTERAGWEIEVMGQCGEDPAEILEYTLELRLLEAEVAWLGEVVARWPSSGESWPTSHQPPVPGSGGAA